MRPRTRKTDPRNAARYGIRFLGPNCLGIVNTNQPLNITVSPILSSGGPFSLASQSGTYIAQTLSYLHQNGIAFGKAISVGNEANIDIVDCIEYLGDDEEPMPSGSTSKAYAMLHGSWKRPGGSARKSPSSPSMSGDRGRGPVGIEPYRGNGRAEFHL